MQSNGFPTPRVTPVSSFSATVCGLLWLALSAAPGHAATVIIACQANPTFNAPEMTIVYEGEAEGTLTIAAPFGEMSLPATKESRHGTDENGQPLSATGIRAFGLATVQMPDKAAVESCVRGKLPPDAEIVGYEVTEYDETSLVEGPFAPTSTTGGTGFKTVEGRITLIHYTLPQGRSSLEVLRNYEESLKSKGFSVVFTCGTTNGSCFEAGQPEAGYLLGEAVGDPLRTPKLVDDYVHNWFQEGGRYLLARLDRPEGAVYAALYLGESNRGAVAVVRVVETRGMETGKIQFITAAEMDAAIAGTGKVAIYGILFDFDKDVIKPESQPTLDEIARLLISEPDLKLRIVGHTDNQGSPEYNLDLSQRRAASVVAALVTSYGIAPGRLASAGAGMTEPVDTNDTEDGRTRNRRVELEALSTDQEQGGNAGTAGG